MICRCWSRFGLVVILGACTPLGLWVYADPVVTVSRVRLELPVGRVDRDSSIPVAKAAVSAVALALPLQKQTTPEGLATIREGRFDDIR